MIRGSIVALITPFNEDRSVNFDKIRELIDWHVEQQTDAILVLGTTAETPTLSEEEEDEIVRIAIEQAAGRVPVIVGSGSNDTGKAIKKSLKYEKMGADVLLVITPYYNKSNKEGMRRHFLAVADAVNTPIYVYNVPARTGMSMTYDVLADICKHKNIVGIKEASGDMGLVCQFSKLISDDFTVYSGNDDINIPLMSMGGAGVISVLANLLPKETHEMAAAYLEGDVKKARDLQVKYLDLINTLFIETNPIPVKEAMNLAGMDVGGYRMPLYPMVDGNRERLRAEMERLGIL